MVTFAFGIHNHQPVDDSDSVIEENYQQAYKPFLDVLREFEAMRVSFHVSGPLLEWLQEHHPEYIENLKELVQSHRVEILSSGLYEPILPLLPEEDRLGQITRFNERLTHVFGAKPRGLWLTERVWEQGLVRTLVHAGIEYVVVDDTHFRNVGFPEDDLFGYYITEDQGRTLAVFPISKRLRYLVPFRDVSETMTLLKDQAQYQGVRLATLFDDGEKFGSWPGSHDHLYKQGWLHRFFTELAQQTTVQMTLFGEFLDQNPALGRAYLDNASYEEMGEWVMTPDRFRQYERVKEKIKSDPRDLPFLRTGYFRSFLTKYTEANRLHKRMIFVSDKVRLSRKPEEKKAPVRTELYKGQGNDAYWHGISGGLYRPHLRHGAYRHLIEADNLLSENAGLKLADFDACGRKEVVFDYKQFFAVLSPNLGGTLMEFDDKQRGINWLDTITRRPESYHTKLKTALRETTDAVPSSHEPPPTTAEGLVRYLHYDPYPRYSLLDHFYKLDATVQNCFEGNAPELHQVALLPRDYELERLKLAMTTVDFLPERPNHLYKEIVLETNRLVVTYDILANFWQPFRFAVDFSLLPIQELLVGGKAIPLDAVGEEKKVSEVLVKHGTGATLAIRARNVPFTLWYYPIETVSSSEKGAERIYQGTALVLNWEQHRPAGVFEFEAAWA